MTTAIKKLNELIENDFELKLEMNYTPIKIDGFWEHLT